MIHDLVLTQVQIDSLQQAIKKYLHENGVPSAWDIVVTQVSNYEDDLHRVWYNYVINQAGKEKERSTSEFFRFDMFYTGVENLKADT